MAENSTLREEPRYVRAVDLHRYHVEAVLPLERDEGGNVEGHPRRTLLEHERTRYPAPVGRRIGVGKKVVIKAGTPIRIALPNLLGDYITTGDIEGILTKETNRDFTRYLKEEDERTARLFEVAVDLPPNEPGVPEVTNQIRIQVPNDMLQLAETPPGVTESNK